jgi:hypothetical protein
MFVNVTHEHMWALLENFISPISDTDIELPIPDHSDIRMNFDIRFRIDQSDVN